MAEITIRISDRILKILLLIVGMLAVGWGFSNLWSSGLFVPKYRLRMYVPEAAGVIIGTPVRLDGVEVGSVNEVKLAQTSPSKERRIELVLRVERRYQNEIRSDSNATLTAEGLLRDRYVSIQRGFNGSPISPGGEITVVPSAQIELKDVINSFAKKADCLDQEKHSTNDKYPPQPKKSSSPH